MKNQLTYFLAALQFLSILPVRGRFETQDIGKSLVWFPAAGFVIGGCAAMVYGITHLLGLPAMIAGLSGVLALAVFSGCLHLDGVADTADGFFSARPRDKILEIMHDSRIGTMGVIGIFTVLALKWAALTSLPPAHAWRVLILAPVIGRTSQIITMARIPYARPRGGLASVFLAHAIGQTIVTSILTSLATAVLFGGVKGIFAVLVSILFIAGFNQWCMRKISGMTGDTLGAVSEGTEAVIMCVMCMGAQ